MCSCCSWLKVGASGMTVQEIGVPTGFEADLESITQLPTLKKVETENRKIVLYLDEVGIQNTGYTEMQWSRLLKSMLFKKILFIVN